MSTDKIWVKAVVDPSLYPFMPGAVIRLWGFDFTIYQDKSLCIEMETDYIRSQVKAGRVRIMDTPPPGILDDIDSDEDETPVQKKVSVKLPDPEFTMDVKSYFGHGNMNNFIENLRKLSVPKIKSFSKERFEKTFPINIKKDDLLDEIRTLTDIEFITSNKDNEKDD